MIKAILLLHLLLFIPGNDLTNIAEMNALKKKAKEAFNRRDFRKAASTYEELVASYKVTDEKVLLNLANSYYHMKDTAQAKAQYQKLLTSPNKEIKSAAFQQIGVMSHRTKQLEEALASFKSALKANPANEDARFNYEVVKKQLEEQRAKEKKEQEQNPDKNKKEQQDKEQEKKEKEQQEKEKGEQEKKEQQEKEGQDQEQSKEEQQQEMEEQKEKEKQEKTKQKQAERLEEMNMTEEKAEEILEALRNKEIQYIQQNKRVAPKKDNGKPDW